MRHLASLSLATSLLLACGVRGSDPDGGTNPDELTRDERALADRGGESSNASQQLAVLADSLFDFDPTIDPSRTAQENAQAIEARVRANLGGTDGGVPADAGLLGCGSVSVSGSTVSVSFGAAPGCTLRDGSTISGTVTVGVTKSAATISLALTLTQVVSNGVPLAGSATFSTTTGTSFTVNASLTSGTTSYVITDLSAVGTVGTTTLNGSVAISGEAATTLTFANLTWALGDCYPNAGTVTSKKGLITTVMTFDANTPASGQVQVSVGRKTSTVSLPAYGSCGVP